MTDERYSILLVDDEEDILDALHDAFWDKFEVYRAKSVDEAMGILEKKHVDLIISDQRMPGTTGAEFFAEIKEDHPKVGRILLTGYSDLQAVVDAINKGSIDKYIAKPWDEHQITQIVLEVLNARLRKEIDQKKQIHAQLVQSAKMATVGELVAGIVHEINNPLGFIHANLGNLNKFSKKIIGLIESYDQLGLPGETKAEIEKSKEAINYAYLGPRIIEMIERSMVGADRMKKIIMDLKMFSRRSAAEFAEADINSAIETTLSIAYNQYKNRIEIKKEFGTLPPANCYISKLDQVFMNLLINACHAIDGKGEIRIRTGIEGSMAKIEFSDTGSGIPEDVIDNIFDPFFTTKPVGQGTGLGLSISHGIIKEHKGEISVESEVGKGTTFTIKIPMDLKAEDMEDVAK